MGEKIRNVYLAMFILFICLPLLGGRILGNYVDSSNYENRSFAPRPTFHVETYQNYPSEYEAFFNDNLPFRNELISLNSWVYYRIFGTPANENVILGKDKWLFYHSVSDGNPLADYEGNLSFSAEETEEMAAASLATQDRLRKMGIRFAVLIPPNKERVYSQHMPERYAFSPISRSDQMMEVLKAKGVPIISPKENLLALRSEYELYYPYDTHWNQLGAYVGTCSVLESWGMATADLSELQISAFERRGDDLANMLHLGEWVFNDGTEYSIAGNFDDGTAPIGEGLAYFENPDAPCKQAVFLLGDSYRTAMKPALCLYFSDVYVADQKLYSYDMLEQASPDCLIVEYVERNSDKLAEIEELVFGR